MGRLSPLTLFLFYTLLPLLIMLAAVSILYCEWLPPVRWGVVFAYYVFLGFSVELGAHRLFSHRAFEASYFVKATLMTGTALSLQGDVRTWGFMHRIHHRFCEDVLDFHSPLAQYNFTGVGGRWEGAGGALDDQLDHGFWFAHTGWLTVPRTFINRQPHSPPAEHVCPDLWEDETITCWQNFLGDGPPASKFYVLAGLVSAAYVTWTNDAELWKSHARSSAFVDLPSTVLAHVLAALVLAKRTLVRLVYYLGFYVSIPVLVTWHAIMAINSVTHTCEAPFCEAPYADAMMPGTCQSRNVPWLWFVHMGGNWHNNHHGAPSSSSVWVNWWQLDMQYAVVVILEALGLVWNVQREQPVAVADAVYHAPYEVALVAAQIGLLGYFLRRSCGITRVRRRPVVKPLPVWPRMLTERRTYRQVRASSTCAEQGQPAMRCATDCGE